ncbi:MAG: hypothetical protein M3Q40_00170 [Pseudomonadota bacterium]|nr:hypothetical protein [Pseudomonadota bacterium]
MNPLKPILLSAVLGLTACGAERAGEEEVVAPEAMSPSIVGDAYSPVQTSPRFGPEGADPDYDADEYAFGVATEGAPGSYLVDSEGHPLYLLEGDIDGSKCVGACLDAWPPVLRLSLPNAERGVDAAMIGTITREDNSLQVAYGGKPLYYYAQDPDGGPPKGHDVDDQWGAWSLVSPEGEPLGEG